MLLSSLFVPTMAYVQSVEQLVNPDAQVVHEQIQSLIIDARAQALIDELPPERFREALFPVVAWCDERLGNLPAWKANHDWRLLMLQKKLFSTSLAGVLFFDRLEAVTQTDNELRELFVLCLSMGFMGRYSQRPNDPALVQLRLDQYKMIRPNNDFTSLSSVDHLFPEAYRVLLVEKSQLKKKRSQRRLLLIKVFSPIFFIVVLGLIFNYYLTQKITIIIQMLKL
jgi:type VI secretion system protein ImpK